MQSYQHICFPLPSLSSLMFVRLLLAPPSPIWSVRFRAPGLHDFERQAAGSGRPRQTKPTHSPLTRANRRNGQYVQQSCAEIYGVVLTFRRVEEQLAAQPEQEGSQERVRKPPAQDQPLKPNPETIDQPLELDEHECNARWQEETRQWRLTRLRTQHSQAEDQQIPFAQGY